MEYAEKTVDSVVMIDRGKKVLDGRLSDIKAMYGRKFVKIEYEGDPNFLTGLDYVKSVRDYGREMEIELNDISLKGRLLKDLAERTTLNSFQLAEPSLNNIFLQKAKEGEPA
jgi:ABC-2 type transport system ATP-binding protein